MRSFLIILFLCTASLYAQPIEGPFTILEMTNPAGFTNPQIALRAGGIADVFYEMGDSVYHMAVEIQSGEIVSNFRALPMEGEGWSRTLCDVVATADGWAALVYDVTYYLNRTLLFRGTNEIVTDTLLHAGSFSHDPFGHDNSSSNHSLHLILKNSGGFYSSWMNTWTYYNGQWGEAGQAFLIHDFHVNGNVRPAYAYYFGPWVMPGLRMDVFEVSDSVSYMLCSTENDLEFFSIFWESYGGEIEQGMIMYPGAHAVGSLYTPGRTLFVVSRSFSVWNEFYSARLIRIQFPSTVTMLRTLDTEPLVGASSPSVGLAWLARYGVGLLVFRADTTGAEHLPEGVIGWPSAGQDIAEAALGMAANGKLTAVWGERLPGGENATILKMASVDWDTPLATDDRDFILHPSSLIFSAAPNPFNARTVVRFELPQTCKVSLDIFDITGRKVATLTHGILASGPHEVNVDGSAWAAGIYFLRLSTPHHQRTSKLVLIK
ncbi:T9SS C-terminal target domain-containing protein [candidate division KSB1 bacterium]|nr:MAG: T9SS C-terminal target domain-containing protein [candidate division KSB1 bacterium]